MLMTVRHRENESGVGVKDPMTMTYRTSFLAAAGVGALALLTAPAPAQTNAGPTLDRTRLTMPMPPFEGKIGTTYKESTGART